MRKSSNIFLLQAHPVTKAAKSFSCSIADRIEGALQSSSSSIRRRNLYEMPDGKCFSPLLTETERLDYFNEGKQTHLCGKDGTCDPHVVDIVDTLRWADTVVFVYPTWWFNVPSVLKGFFDRCFVPGVGFRYDHALGKRTVGLTNISRVGVVTTYGFDEPTVLKAGDAGKVMIQGGMSMLFSPEVEHHWDALYSMQGTQLETVRTEFLNRIEMKYKGFV
eukprot:PhF_6_TR38843/c0_g1_i1/m.58085